MTLLELLSDAFYELGIYSPSETIDADHAQFAGRRLNSMIDSWKSEKLNVYREQRTGPFNLVANTQTYTIGSGATWNTPRPIWIDFAGLVQTVGGGTPVPEYPIHVMTDFEWAMTVVKALTSTLPTGLWYDRSFTSSGYGTITMWPIPTVANQVVLYSPVPVDEFSLTDLSVSVLLPPGYRDFLMYHLAIRIAPSFGKSPNDVTIAMASTAMEKVKNSNLRMNTLRVDDAILRKQGGIYNYLSDTHSYR